MTTLLTAIFVLLFLLFSLFPGKTLQQEPRPTLWDLGTPTPMVKTATATVLANAISPVIPTSVSSSNTPTQSPSLVPVNGIYNVVADDQLGFIASALNVSLNDLRSANYMYGDCILPGQRLIIPTLTPVAQRPWRYSSLDKDQPEIGYPLTQTYGQFDLHYSTNSFPAVDPDAIAGLVKDGMEHVEEIWGKNFPYRFDIYVAGSLYPPPNRYLRGRSFSKDFKVFFLHDGSGSAADQQYLAAHEMTHLYAWNIFGEPDSFVVSEGAAVYTGLKITNADTHVPLKTFCAAFHKEGKLPMISKITEPEDFRGHNNNLVNYYASGCFVEYLVETYGMDSFSKVYSTSDYPGVYGKTLTELDAEWKSSIIVDDFPAGLDSRRLVEAVDQFMNSNRLFYDFFYGTETSLAAYRELGEARLCLLAIDLSCFDQRITRFNELFKGQP